MPPAETSPDRSRTDAAGDVARAPTGALVAGAARRADPVHLCPRYCRLGDGQAGFCFIRQNHGGEMVLLGYGRSTGFAIDPIEKKPLNHFSPGHERPVVRHRRLQPRLQVLPELGHLEGAARRASGSRRRTPEAIVDLAIAQGCAVAWPITYNDPVIWAEYAIDIARAAAARGIKAVAVTAGYITAEARPEFYADDGRRQRRPQGVHRGLLSEGHRSSHLEPVLDTLKWLRHETQRLARDHEPDHPRPNDGDDEMPRMASWVLARPRRRRAAALHGVPPRLQDDATSRRTPPATLRARARDRARRRAAVRLHGQRARRDGRTTYCPRCGAAGHRARLVRDHALRPTKDGACAQCGHPLPGRFGAEPVALRSGFRRLRVSI